MAEEPEYKIITIGDVRVGKTSIIYRMIGIGFNPCQQATPRGSYYMKHISLTHETNGEEKQYLVSAALWDTFGEERFYALNRIYYRSAECVIIVFDIANRKSFERVKHWFDECMNILEDDEISIAIVGNKTDLENERQVSYQEGIELCQSLVEDDGYSQINHNGISPKKYREKCQLLCDAFLRISESNISSAQYSFNLASMQNIFWKNSEPDFFIPMDIYRLCFRFYFIPQRSTINYFETSAKTDDGIDEMLESLIRIKLDIDHCDPPPRPYRDDYRGDLIMDEEESKYTKQSNGIWGVYAYVSDWLSSYL